MSNLALITLIDAELPQTQCGLCGHPGCLPYAKAIALGEDLNKCVPGGQPVTDTLAQLLNRPTLPVVPSKWPIAADKRPQRITAIIREAECIGCTKCITACPVDAILGTGKMMHTIITDLCTGCELCIPPCPVDCIDLVELTEIPDQTQQKKTQEDLRARFNARLKRDNLNQLQSNTNRKPTLAVNIYQDMTTDIPTVFKATATPHQNIHQHADTLIKQATLRSQIKKLQRQLNVMPENTALKQQLAHAEQELQQLTASCESTV